MRPPLDPLPVLPRRSMLKLLAAGATTTFFVPRRLRAVTPNSLRLAFIGVGGHAEHTVRGLTDHPYVAFCDVDEARAAESYAAFPDVPRFRDVRQMLDRHAANIDAVVITTPDHSHYPLTMACLEAGKHVYLEKPMATTAWECRRLAAMAAHKRVVTQLGLQGHSFEGLVLLREWVEAEVVGKIREVWLWTDRTRPETSVSSRSLPDPAPPPATLDWTGWQADRPLRPYSPSYVPYRWRNWWGYGSGAICDIGMHMFDVVRTTFDTEFPEVVEAQVSDVSAFTVPQWAQLRWQFRARDGRGPLTVHWYNGWENGAQRRPAQVPGVPLEVVRATKNGMAFVGTEGTLFIPDMRASRRPKIYPEEREREVLASPPPKRLPRRRGGHADEWLAAIREGRKANADFAYGAALTEQVLLGTLAERTLKPIRWDPRSMRAVDVPEADAFVRPPRGPQAWEPSAADARHLPD